MLKKGEPGPPRVLVIWCFQSGVHLHLEGGSDGIAEIQLTCRLSRLDTLELNL